MPSERRLLIIEDEEGALRALERYFRQRGFAVDAAQSGESGLEVFQDRAADVVLLDYKLPGMDGELVFAKMKAIQPQVPVIVMTAYGEIDRAVRLLKAGAYYYITKPFELEVLRHLVEEAAGKIALSRENARLQERLQGRYSFANLVYRSEIMAETVNLAMRVADSEATVLLSGESGTGKEVLANIIHFSSPRRSRPFVKVNLAALPATLIESELFGHEKGAFTGADRARIGRFEEAQGGTIFLDEIGDLPQETQIKLLRVIQEREIVRLGANKPIPVDIRLLSATHRDLAAEAKRRAFREDLYFRVNTITIPVPPLRRRKEDIPFLVDHFLKKFAERERKAIRGIERKALNALLRYDFPGNIRELEHIVERAVILCRGDELGEDDLPPLSGEKEVPGMAAGSSLPDQVRGFERKVILEALERNRFVGTKAARELGISESTLRYKMDSLGIKPG
jgi:two-component system NtrC family response regulator